jgi:hypothetical protein
MVFFSEGADGRVQMRMVPERNLSTQEEAAQPTNII